MNLLTYASGYPRPYKTDEDEIRVLETEEAIQRTCSPSGPGQEGKARLSAQCHAPASLVAAR
jgi:hypothetical protein